MSVVLKNYDSHNVLNNALENDINQAPSSLFLPPLLEGREVSVYFPLVYNFCSISNNSLNQQNQQSDSSDNNIDVAITDISNKNAVYDLLLQGLNLPHKNIQLGSIFNILSSTGLLAKIRMMDLSACELDCVCVAIITDSLLKSVSVSASDEYKVELISLKLSNNK
jgi:hypothetical protein